MMMKNRRTTSGACKGYATAETLASIAGAATLTLLSLTWICAVFPGNAAASGQSADAAPVVIAAAGDPAARLTCDTRLPSPGEFAFCAELLLNQPAEAAEPAHVSGTLAFERPAPLPFHTLALLAEATRLQSAALAVPVQGRPTLGGAVVREWLRDNLVLTWLPGSTGSVLPAAPAAAGVQLHGALPASQRPAAAARVD
ncbi:hypothetical protein DB346_05740 [Verrucomicrobia bacterium LW23]|nr:hypothetical protein DB346_05740 [Verrucomicrobia bacterium LW23]